MDDKIKNQILKLKKEGKSYGEISSITGVCKSTIVTTIKRAEVKNSIEVCPVCGKTLLQTKGHRQKKYCSDSCRMYWWKKHRDELNLKSYYTCICKNCNKEFISYSRNNRKYCGLECYYISRKDCGLNG